MNRKTISDTSYVSGVLMFLLAIGISGVSIADDKNDPPSKTIEGLELVKETKHRLVYLAPNADLSQYTDVAILECFVAFVKDWERDYNRDAISLQRQVSDNDMDRIKKRLAAEFKEIFTEEVTKDGKHNVVDHVGPDVLILRPAIVNLDVTAVGDQNVAGRSRTYSASAGQMTLYLELYDSVTSTIIAKITDAQADRRGGSSFQMSSSVTNTSAADRILRSWARELIDHLGEVKE
jgi:hypothetical protein